MLQENQARRTAICPCLSIRNEEDYDRAVEQMTELIDVVGMNEDRPMYESLDTLGTIIDAYEEKNRPKLCD